MAAVTHGPVHFGAGADAATGAAARAASAAVLVRVALGPPMIYHGAGIALGLFGGPGIHGFSGATHLPLAVAALVGWGELLGGLGVLFGVLTRLAAAGTGVIMLGAILLVHLKNGFDITNKQGPGFEYALALFLISVTLVAVGGGPYSLGALLAKGGKPAQARS